MPRKIDPFNGLSYGWNNGETGWGSYVNDNFVQLGAKTFPSVEDDSLTTPPAIVNGKRYLVATGATGAWSGKDGQIACAIEGAWTFITITEGQTLFVKAGPNAQKFLVKKNAGWQEAGGSAITTISANTTINVPGDYATVNAALNYVRSAVILNGADITILVANGTTLNEQITLTNEYLPFLTLKANGTVNVNTTGFTANLLGTYTCFVALESSSIKEFSGTWTKTSGAVSTTGFMALDSRFTLGSFTGVQCNVNSFVKCYDIITSYFTAIYMGGSGNTTQDTIQNSHGWILNGSLVKGLQWWGGFAQIDSLSVSNSGAANKVLSLRDLSLTINGLNLTQNFDSPLIYAERCDIKGQFGNITSDAFDSGTSVVMYFQNCDINVYSSNLNLTGSASAAQLFFVTESNVHFAVGAYTQPTAYALQFLDSGSTLSFVTPTDIIGSLPTLLTMPVNTVTSVGTLLMKDDSGNTATVNTSSNLNATHWGKYVRTTNAGAIVLTINDSDLSAMPVGGEINVRQAGAGSVTFAAGGSATLNYAPGLQIKGQHYTVTVKKVSATSFDLIGALV